MTSRQKQQLANLQNGSSIDLVFFAIEGHLQISSLKNSQMITAGYSLALLNIICKCFSTRALLSQRESYEYYSVM